MQNDEMEDKAFSSIDFVGQCLLDPEKAAAFKEVIQKVITPKSNVLDVGTGSGILALLSATAGAKKVTALEFDPFVAKIAKENFKNNNCGEIIDTLIGDARNFKFKEGTKFDVVTMEMLTSGMVDEMQVQAINNLHEQGAVSSDTVFLPCRQDSYINLANIDFNLFDFKMKMVLHAWKFFQNIKNNDLSNKVLLNSIDFSKPANEQCDAILTLKATMSGIVNAIWLSSQAFVDRETFLENTKSLNPPVAIPVQDTEVVEGQVIKVHIKYKFGHGYKNFSVEIL